MTEFLEIEELKKKILLLEKENQSLKSINKKYFSLLENSPANIIITDLSGRIEYTNPDFQKLTGYQFEEVKGKNPRILNSGVHSREFYQGLWTTISSGNVWHGELYNRKKNGDHYWEKAHIAPIKNDDGEIINYVSIKFEITVQKLAENELNDQIQSKDKILSIISHDLKSPFGSVVGLTDIVIENYDRYPSNEIIKIFQIVNTSARQALDLLENLLNWGRSQTGKIKPSPASFYLSQLVTETISSIETQANNKKIFINNSVNEEIKVIADSNWTKIILRNLFTNAIKYSFQEGIIDISASESNDFIEISVTDNGVGIASENIPKLFKQELKYTTLGTSNEKGTGLGLLLCKEFAERQGGKIYVESKEGEGSRFTFTLNKNN
jgi:PAS domain S-box-containing protein